MIKFLGAAVLLSIASFALPPTALALPNITFTDLGIIQEPGNIRSNTTIPRAINASGRITGFSWVGSGGIDPGNDRAFRLQRRDDDRSVARWR